LCSPPPAHGPLFQNEFVSVFQSDGRVEALAEVKNVFFVLRAKRVRLHVSLIFLRSMSFGLTLSPGSDKKRSLRAEESVLFLKYCPPHALFVFVVYWVAV